MLVSPDGLPTPPPRKHRGKSPFTSAQLRKRNDRLLALTRVLGLSTADLAQLFSRPLGLSAIQKALCEARARSESRGGADPTPAIDGADFTRRDLLDTPTTDDPSGPRYRDIPEAVAWIEANQHTFRADPAEPPTPRAIRRRTR